MAFLAFLSVVAVIALFILQIFFLLQLAEVGINLMGAGEGFFTTGNFWAWVVVFLLMLVGAFVVRLLFKLFNGLITLGLGSLFSLPDLRKAIPNSYSIGKRMAAAGLIMQVSWFMATFFLTGAAMGYFSAHPELNDWLAGGSWLAHVLVYFGILGLVLPSTSKDD